MLKGGIVDSTKKNADQTPPFYQLVEKLFVEARLLPWPVQRKLVSEGKLSRFQRSTDKKRLYKKDILNKTIIMIKNNLDNLKQYKILNRKKIKFES
jgi:hypothetical protein